MLGPGAGSDLTAGSGSATLPGTQNITVAMLEAPDGMFAGLQTFAGMLGIVALVVWAMSATTGVSSGLICLLVHSPREVFFSVIGGMGEELRRLPERAGSGTVRGNLEYLFGLRRCTSRRKLESCGPAQNSGLRAALPNQIVGRSDEGRMAFTRAASTNRLDACWSCRAGGVSERRPP